MPLPLSTTAARWRAALAGERPVTGMWVASGSPVVAEICAGSGVDWLIDQGLLIPKRLYQKVGGYRALADMEDADLVRRIGRRRLVGLRARAINIARPHKGALRGLALTLLHALRVPSRLLANL